MTSRDSMTALSNFQRLTNLERPCGMNEQPSCTNRKMDEGNIMSSNSSVGSFSFMSCSPLTASSGKVERNPLLAFLPAVIDDDDGSESDSEIEFDNISEGMSYPSSFGSELDRVVTPFAPFHPDIPLVRTRVLEELTERMPVPYPSEPALLSRSEGMSRPPQLALSPPSPKIATQYITSIASQRPNLNEASMPFDPNIDEKMVFHGEREFDTLLGRQDDEGSVDQDIGEDFGFFAGPRKASSRRAGSQRDLLSRMKGIGKRRRPKPKADATEDRHYCEEIGECDVLLGRGPQIYQHEGNQRFHDLKQSIQPRYLEAPKDGKVSISQSLVDAIHDSGGRFLKYDESKGMWYSVLNKVAREKAAQALRETFTKEDRQRKRLKYKKSPSDTLCE